jgi:hypothetical protein
MTDAEMIKAPEEEFNQAIADAVTQLDGLYEQNPDKTLQELIDDQAGGAGSGAAAEPSASPSASESPEADEE